MRLPWILGIAVLIVLACLVAMYFSSEYRRHYVYTTVYSTSGIVATAVYFDGVTPTVYAISWRIENLKPEGTQELYLHDGDIRYRLTDIDPDIVISFGATEWHDARPGISPEYLSTPAARSNGSIEADRVSFSFHEGHLVAFGLGVNAGSDGPGTRVTKLAFSVGENGRKLRLPIPRDELEQILGPPSDSWKNPESP